MAKYLVVNLGSASKKYGLFDDGEKIAEAHFETEDANLIAQLAVGEASEIISVDQDDYNQATIYFTDYLIKRGIISGLDDLGGIAIRVVAPGEFFLQHKIIDQAYINELNRVKKDLAPLHLTPVLVELEQLKKSFPNQKLIAVSDSAFHSQMPLEAQSYAIPDDWRKLGIRRYGYHGISLESIVEKINFYFPALPSRIIVCHLGGGASVTAIKNGRTEDTSMGFSPLEGLPMAERVGNMDAQVILYLIRQGKSTEELEEVLNQRSGLLGLSGVSSDVRKLLKLEDEGNKLATLTLNFYVQSVVKYIGAYAVLLGGIDLLVFTGTIGLRSVIMRQRICQRLGLLNIVLNLDLNSSVSLEKQEGFIANETLGPKVLVLKTDELKMMARVAKNLLET